MAATALVGRILLSLIFILAGVNKIGGLSGTVAYMTQHHIPAASVLVWAAIAVEVGGGLCVLLGLRSRAAAALLALFVMTATVFFHTNLVVTQPQDQTVNFLKNLAIIGGLLTLTAHGPGRLSIDGRESAR